MRIALTGVSGFIGSVIARHLRAGGHSVSGLVRTTSRRDHVEAWVDRFVVGDQADTTAWPELLEGADAVVHNSVDFSAFDDKGDFDRHLRGNLLGSIGLLRAAAPRPFLFVSSVAVHHDISPRWEGRIDEDHPLRPGSWYGAYKAAVEAHLWTAWHQGGQPVYAVRPCAVYGLDPRRERSIGHPIVRSIRAGEPYRRRGGGKFVHVDDVAAAVVALLGNPGAAGRPYDLADCYARWADWAAVAAELLGVEADIDLSSPEQPRNQFTCAAIRALGITLDRGHGGIRAHVRELIDEME